MTPLQVILYVQSMWWQGGWGCSLLKSEASTLPLKVQRIMKTKGDAKYCSIWPISNHDLHLTYITDSCNNYCTIFAFKVHHSELFIIISWVFISLVCQKWSEHTYMFLWLLSFISKRWFKSFHMNCHKYLRTEEGVTNRTSRRLLLIIS